jgi:hypothetical protein
VPIIKEGVWGKYGEEKFSSKIKITSEIFKTIRKSIY